MPPTIDRHTPPREHDDETSARRPMLDRWLDAALEDSFPASDPIAWPRSPDYATGDGR